MHTGAGIRASRLGLIGRSKTNDGTGVRRSGDVWGQTRGWDPEKFVHETRFLGEVASGALIIRRIFELWQPTPAPLKSRDPGGFSALVTKFALGFDDFSFTLALLPSFLQATRHTVNSAPYQGALFFFFSVAGCQSFFALEAYLH